MSDDIKSKKVCGIVMPIAAMDDCPESHWAEVKQIIVSVVEELGYECKLVSDETDVGVIHKRIVQNLYENNLIICDVSCKNANVMFELGMRLAFDKPIILIKDDKTPYSFDTSPVEHLTYRRDLRFSSVNEFKVKLSAKVSAVMESDNKSSFLSSFGTFKTAEIKSENVEPYELLFEELSAIRKLVTSSRSIFPSRPLDRGLVRGRSEISVHEMQVSSSGRSIMVKCSGPLEAIEYFKDSLSVLEGVEDVIIGDYVEGSATIIFDVENGFSTDSLLNSLIVMIKPNKVVRPAGSSKNLFDKRKSQ